MNQAIEHSPEIMQNWVLLALLEKWLGRTDSCMQICEKILSMDPYNDSAYQMKGDIFKGNLKIDEALAQYSKAIQINPESSSAISSIGDVLKFRGQWTEALQHYKKSLTLNNN